MLRYIVHITDPKQEKKVEELLEGIKGIEVERDPAKPKRAARKSSAKRKAPTVRKRKPATAAEKRFMKDLTEAFEAAKDHFSGKKKLKTLKEVLDEL